MVFARGQKIKNGGFKMFLVKIFKDNQQISGNSYGQGFYQHKTFRNFKRHVLDNPKHVLNKTCKNWNIKVYECSEYNKYDDSKMLLVYEN